MHKNKHKKQNTKQSYITIPWKVQLSSTTAGTQGWYQVNRQEKLLMKEGEEEGDGRAEGLSAIGDGGQAVMSLMPDVIDAWHWHLWKFTIWRFVCRGLTVLLLPHQGRSFIGRTDAEAEAQILWPPDVKSRLIGKDPDVGKDLGQEEKGITEDEIVGWHHWLNGHESVQILGDREGQRSMVCCSPWVGHDLVTEQQ